MHSSRLETITVEQNGTAESERTEQLLIACYRVTESERTGFYSILRISVVPANV